MALTATLEFGDNSIKRYSKQYLVADCRFVVDRPYDSFSPNRTTRFERIELNVVAPEKMTCICWSGFPVKVATTGGS